MPLPARQVFEFGALQIVFERQGGRWGHRIELLGNNRQTTPLLASIENGSEEVVPLSPPLQEIQPQTVGGTTVALGVGTAGQSHWSVVCGPERSSGLPRKMGSICFEVACRVREDVPHLVSTYEVLSPTQWLMTQSHALILRAAEVQLRVFSDESITRTESGFAVVRRRRSLPATPCTVQWSYTIEVLG